jgi:hypothetical protein
MISISTPLIAASALIAIGLVALDDMALRPTSDEPPAAAVAGRFPQPHEMLAFALPPAPAVDDALALRNAERAAAPGACVHEHWPYIADECLVTADRVVPRAVRTITIERRKPVNAPYLLQAAL